MSEILESAKFVSDQSNSVAINDDRTERVAHWLAGDGIELPAWDYGQHYFDGTAKTVAYLLILDSLNFCFWAEGDQPRWEIEYQSARLSGYAGLAASLTRAVRQGSRVCEAGFLAEITRTELKELLGGSPELPLMEERRQILNELGQVLLQDYQGQAAFLVEEASGSALKLAFLLARKFKSFRDVAQYKGREVLFLKRAQIFSADLYATFRGEAWGHFIDMEKLTAFADYKLPQVLRHFGLLTYSPELVQKVDRMILLPPGSPEEVEIRANTIWAVEGIRRNLEHLGRPLRAFEIDWLLWNLGQHNFCRDKPYHRTLTFFY